MIYNNIYPFTYIPQLKNSRGVSPAVDFTGKNILTTFENGYFALNVRASHFKNKVSVFHRHEEFEFLLVDSGKGLVGTESEQFVLSPGQACFINSETLHYFGAASGAPDAVFHLFVVHRRFIAGMSTAHIDRKYVSPIFNNPDIGCRMFDGCTDLGAAMVAGLRKLWQLEKDEPFGFELDVRRQFLLVWKYLYQFLEDASLLQPEVSQDYMRFSAMLKFIHTHYQKPLTLKDIADSGQVSERECSRCFLRQVQSTPIKYLTEYRVRIAAMQLAETNDSLSNIAVSCGFYDQSHLTKRFKAVLKCSPMEYRKNHQTPSLL